MGLFDFRLLSFIGIKIPPETRTGKILRLKELGLPKKTGGYGNLNVKISINIPSSITLEQKELYKKLYNLEWLTKNYLDGFFAGYEYQFWEKSNFIL